MTAYRLAIVVMASLTLAHTAAPSPALAADTIPRWDIAEICSASTLGAKCPAIESQNRRAVFQRWEALPVAARTACQLMVLGSGKPSYKQLLECLEERQLKALDETPHSASAAGARAS